MQTFLDDPKLTVVSQNPKNEILNLQDRSAVLDLVCKLGSGETVNVEVQKLKTTDHLRRVRYYFSLITTLEVYPSTSGRGGLPPF